MSRNEHDNQPVAIGDDGVFISAADLFTLLSIVLLSLSLFESKVDLRGVNFTEVAPRSSTADPIKQVDARLSATWESTAGDCALEITGLGVDPSQTESFSVDCIPGSFTPPTGNHKPSYETLRAMALKHAKIVAKCKKGKRNDAKAMESSLTRCAQLQWTLHYLGFDPIVEVAKHQISKGAHDDRH